MLDDVVRLVTELLTAELEALHYLGPLRSFPPRHLAFVEADDLNWFAGGGHAWDVVRRNSRVRAAVNRWLSDPERLQTPYELLVRDLVATDDLESAVSDGIYELDSGGLTMGEEQDTRWDPPSLGPQVEDPEREVKRMMERFRTTEIERHSD